MEMLACLARDPEKRQGCGWGARWESGQQQTSIVKQRLWPYRPGCRISTLKRRHRWFHLAVWVRRWLGRDRLENKPQAETDGLCFGLLLGTCIYVHALLSKLCHRMSHSMHQ